MQTNDENTETCDSLLDVSTSSNDNILYDVMLSDSATNYLEVKHVYDDYIDMDTNTATDKIIDDEFHKVSILPSRKCKIFFF